MSIAAPQTRFTPEDLLDLRDEGRFELVDGKLVEKKMSSLANKTVTLISFHVFSFIRASRLGDLYTEQAYQCFPDDRIRRPDLSFVPAQRAPLVPREGHCPIPPDLAIEVLSPNDKAYDLDKKLLDYRTAGVKLTWVVNPDVRTLRIHRADHSITELQETDTLTGESVLPGFSISVKELLPPNVDLP